MWEPEEGTTIQYDIIKRRIYPLCEMSLSGIHGFIWNAPTALVREIRMAAESLTETNCWWVAYQLKNFIIEETRRTMNRPW